MAETYRFYSHAGEVRNIPLNVLLLRLQNFSKSLNAEMRLRARLAGAKLK